ncbi:8187_t:CDS:2, partial [Funneliformis mosseae]
ALEPVILSDRELKKDILTDEDWNNLEQIAKFLILFKEVTIIMSGFTYPTISTVIPLYNLLIDHIEDTIDNINTLPSIKLAAEKCKEKILEYYNKTNNIYLFATILDSRLKLQYFKGKEWGDELIKTIQESFLSNYNTYYKSLNEITSNILYENENRSIISNKRNRLLGKTVRYCMCLKSWWTGPLNELNN